MEIEIKDEPVWHEGTANDSLGNFELVSEMVLLKQETKSELIEPRPAEENTFKPSADSKEEVLVEQDKVELPVPNIKEENMALKITKSIKEAKKKNLQVASKDQCDVFGELVVASQQIQYSTARGEGEGRSGPGNNEI
ncbi:uncharacterized protein [Anabrus simplex]|uniref:uncharacterized protein isoform X3 n=1 Tax=Anabrus simplex TaxID=316456 RepID=UPI0035A28884